MNAEEGLFKFKKGRRNQKKKPKSAGRKSKKPAIADGDDPGNAEKSFGKVNPKGKVQKRKRNPFPKKAQISDGTKKYDLKQLEEKIAALHAVSEPNKKLRKKIRQLEYLQKKITQIIMTQQSLVGEEAGIEDEDMDTDTKDIVDETHGSEDEMKDMEDEAKNSEDETEESDNEDETEESDNEDDENGDDDETKDSNELNNSDNEEENVKNEGENGDNKSSDEGSDSDKDDEDSKGVKRFVVFVGNLPKDVTKADIKTHFAKVGNIKSIRIPENKETRKSGFAFVELEDRLVYEKKNAKLDAMRKSGQLAGSIPEHQRRSFRRKKKRLAEAKAAAEAR